MNMVKSQREVGVIFSRLYNRYVEAGLTPEDGLRLYLTSNISFKVRERLYAYFVRSFGRVDAEHGGDACGTGQQAARLAFPPIRAHVEPSDFWNVCGMYQTEPWGAWAGKEMWAKVRVPDDYAGGELAVALSVGGYAFAESPTRTLSVSVNGMSLPPLMLDHFDPRKYEIDLPAELAGTTVFDFHLRLDADFIPAELGHSADIRRLGIAFGWLEIFRKWKGDGGLGRNSTWVPSTAVPTSELPAGTRVTPADALNLCGTYEVEPWGVWAGKEMYVKMHMPDDYIGGELVASLFVGGYVFVESPKRVLSISVNGKELSSVELAHIEPRKYEFAIPAEVADSAILNFRLLLDTDFIPSEQGHGGDPRRLGIAFGGLELSRKAV